MEEEKKAYDVKDLLAKLKAEQGLDIAEDAAKHVVKSTLDWVKDSADISDGIVDDIIVKFLPAIEEYVLEQVDKIDGKDDEKDDE